MSKPKAPTGLARRPWHAWLELQYRLADEVIAHTLGENPKELEEVPSDLREQKRDTKLYEIVKFFYDQVESATGKDISDEPLFAISAEQNWNLARILGCLGGSYYGEQEIPQKTWNKDLAAVRVAINSARDWFVRYDRSQSSTEAQVPPEFRIALTLTGAARRLRYTTKKNRDDAGRKRVKREIDAGILRALKVSPRGKTWWFDERQLEN